ncbi:hypothetical protein Tco_0016577 [Tanacetum coccineum]
MLKASNHEDASDTGAAPKQQQQVIPQTTAISNIKLPILKKEEYEIIMGTYEKDFHGMDDGKEFGKPFRDLGFGGNAKFKENAEAVYKH